jgi:hypothetical protein
MNHVLQYNTDLRTFFHCTATGTTFSRRIFEENALLEHIDLCKKKVKKRKSRRLQTSNYLVVSEIILL